MTLLNNLRVRLVLWTVMLEAGLLIIFAGLFVVALQSNQSQQIDETLRLSATQVNAVVDIEGSHYNIPPEDVSTLQARGLLVWLIKPDGTIAATVGGGSNQSLPSPMPTGSEMIDGTLSNGIPIRIFAAPIAEGNRPLGMVVLAMSLENSRQFIRQVVASLIVALPLVLILSSMGGLFLAGRALSPVAEITETASRISADDLTQRLTLNLPDDEIGHLAKTFNDMLERLDSAFQRERQLTSDVSHELRTPLALLKTQIGLARSRPRDAETLLQMIVNMEGDVDRMTRLVQQLLTLTRIEYRGSQETSSVDIGHLLTHIVSSFQNATKDRDLSLMLQLPAQIPLFVQGNANRLEQIFTNLIDNAFKYTPDHGIITIRAVRHWDTLQIAIQDTGIGIGSEHLSHIFERFYRVDEARSRDKGGFGLGLAIVQEIIRAHGGSIIVTSQSGIGTEFIITLPASVPFNPQLTP